MTADSLPRPNFSFAKRHGATITGLVDGKAQLACREDVQPWVLAELRRQTSLPIALQRLSTPEYEQLIQRLYEEGAGDTEQAAAELGETEDLDQIAEALPEPEDLLESQDDAPIIKLINALLTSAVRENASDVHIEPFESRLVVRFRVDGVLREILSPPRKLSGLIVSRIKVMAQLDIAEKRVPQDGRISLRVAGRPVDVRVSTLPSGHGERVVLRLLDKQSGRLNLSDLGMDDATLARLDRLIERPHGIFLVTGPTGSGKTTTLYAALSKLNKQQHNIMTVEDPIEYYLDGIGQTQVNPRVDLSFARGLRAILRQDPDVVMVGEIRDLETASIAVQASLTGHLVLSTLHTNTAVGAVTRLRDMGVEPFLLSSSLIGAMAQRLVRRLDPETRIAVPATAEQLAEVGKPADREVTLYRPDLNAPGGGYKGRLGLFELVAIDDTMRDQIHSQASESELAKTTTAPTLFEDGWRKTIMGMTSLEEVQRVTRDRGDV